MIECSIPSSGPPLNQNVLVSHFEGGPEGPPSLSVTKASSPSCSYPSLA